MQLLSCYPDSKQAQTEASQRAPFWGLSVVPVGSEIVSAANGMLWRR